MTHAITPLAIDVVSDVVCPWCYLGKRRLARAFDLVPDVAVAVRWRPYQLDPTIPPEGRDRKAYMAAKFPDAAQLAAVHDRLRDYGRAEGIDFRFDDITRSPNTLDAHRLIRWATVEGVAEAVVEDLFAAYFTRGEDLGDHAVLAAIAAAAGMDGALMLRLLAGDADRAEVEAEIAEAQRLGITGVPCTIVGGRYAVMGAREPEAIAAAIDAAIEAGPAARD